MLSLKNGWNTGNVNRRERERDKQNELSKKYNRGVNIIGVINNCLSVTATIVAAPAVIGMDAVSIVMGLLRVVGNRVTKMISLK